jgi:hypothetical protein
MPNGIIMQDTPGFCGLEQLAPHMILHKDYFSSILTKFSGSLEDTVLSYEAGSKKVAKGKVYMFLDRHKGLTQRLFDQYIQFCEKATASRNKWFITSLLKAKPIRNFVNGEYDFMLNLLAYENDKGESLAERIRYEYQNNLYLPVADEMQIKNLISGLTYILEQKEKRGVPITSIDIPLASKNKKTTKLYAVGAQIAAYLFHRVYSDISAT